MARYTKNMDVIETLTPEQYRVTQESGTERPGTGEYLDNKEPGPNGEEGLRDLQHITAIYDAARRA